MKATPLKRKTPLSRGTPPRVRKPIARKAAKRSKPRVMTANRWRCEAYLKWVRHLHCCHCGTLGGDAHHVIGLHWDLSGAGLTAPDSFAMPLCRVCHDQVHKSPELQRLQPDWLRWTISRGVREFEGEVRLALVEAWQFIDSKEMA